MSAQGLVADPKLLLAAEVGMRAVLMATEAKLERAVLAPLAAASCQVGRALEPLEVKTWPDVPTPETCCKAPVEVVPAAKMA